MIAKISKGKYFKSFIDYNEKKVDEGKAKLIANTTFATDRIGYNRVFLSLCDNEKVVRRKGEKIDATNSQAVHFSLNFPDLPGRNLTEDFLAEYAETYLEKMGYTNHPFLVYQHFDTNHTHLHIVTSRYDWESVKLSTTQDWKKSNNVSLKLSEQYDLPKYTDYKFSSEKQRKTLEEINKSKFSFSRALKKGFNHSGYNSQLSQFISGEERNYLSNLESDLSNEQMKSLFGENRFSVISNFLDSKNLFNPLVKENLTSLIKSAKEKTKDIPSFISYLQDHDVYVREVFNADPKIRETGFQYGYAGKYFNEGSLNPSCRLSKLKIHFYGEKAKDNKNVSLPSFNQYEQASFIKKRLSFILKSNKEISSFSSLQEALNKDGIELITHQNSAGIYGISFKSHNVKDPTVIKGSEIDFSVSKLNFLFLKSSGPNIPGEANLVNSVLIHKEFSKQNIKEDSFNENLVLNVTGSLGMFSGMGMMDDVKEQDLNDVKRKKKNQKRHFKK